LEFKLKAGCKTELVGHFVFSNSSITSGLGLEHVTLTNIVSLQIPNISPYTLESIMSSMTKDVLYRPTMNDIIEAHDQLEEFTQRTSRFSSMIAWLMFSVFSL
jgi:hypothetical protein